MFCVGKEILWTRKIPNTTRGGQLLCATVMFYDETLEKFKLLYRDGKDEWVSGFQIDEELDHEKGYTLQQKVASIGEAWHRDAQRKIKEYGPYCVRYVGIRKWGPTNSNNPAPPSKLASIVMAVKANLPPPSNMPASVVMAVTKIIMGKSSSTTITDPDPSTSVPAATNSNTPAPSSTSGSIFIGANANRPLPSSKLDSTVMADNANLPTPSPSMPEAPSQGKL